MRHAPALIAIVAASVAVPAQARERVVDVPPGTAAQSAITLARQTDASIIVTGSRLANRRIPRIRGRMSMEAAVLRLAEAADARAIRIGSASWRLEPRPARRAAPRTAARPPQPRPAPSRVQAAPTPSPPIIVTATKRDLKLLNTPVQVSLLDGEELTMGGTGGTEEITQRVAAVSSTSLGSGRNKLFIRGIADSSFTGPTQATVGQYFGDIRLSYNAPDPDLRLSDLDRVEVLEGPQGTRRGSIPVCGASSTCRAVHPPAPYSRCSARTARKVFRARCGPGRPSPSIPKGVWASPTKRRATGPPP